jgi:hypothetical protein
LAGIYNERFVTVNGQFMDERLQNVPEMQEEIHDLPRALNQAIMKDLPSDINATPANASNAARRLLKTMHAATQRPLTLMNDDSKQLMENILEEEQQRAKQETIDIQCLRQQPIKEHGQIEVLSGRIDTNENSLLEHCKHLAPVDYNSPTVLSFLFY